MNNPTLQHLALLGYKSGDRVCYRGFLPEKGGDKGRKAEATFPTIPSDLKRWEAEERGVYVVVNPGGQLDKEITQGVAIFYEHDQLSRDISRELWQELGLPEPTFQVDTGSKSIHSYWVFSEPISVEQWKPLQADLLEFADGDRSIKNPSRVMRLAGIKHPKTGERAAIITQSGQRYDYATLRAVIPSPAPTRSLQPQGGSSRAITWAEFERSFQFPCSESIPLEICLSKASREALERGAGEGGRNDTGTKLARDLLGASGYLESLGQRYEGDPRDLFDAYCDRCSPPLPQGERESIWKSAEGSDPGPSLSPDAIESCAKSWVWKNCVKPHSGSKGFGESTKQPSKAQNPEPRKNDDLLTLDQVRQQLQRLIEEGVTNSDIEIEIADLAKRSGNPTQTIKNIYQALLQEFERSESAQGAISVFSELTRASSQTCDMEALMPSLAEPLGRYAKAFNQDSVAFALPLLTVAASLLSPETDLVIGGMTDYRVPPVIWGGLVAEPGSIKTPIFNAILKPLRFRQGSAQQEYERQLGEYHVRIENFRSLSKENAEQADKPEEPKLRQYYVDSTTTEAVQKIVTSQIDKGLVVSVDELSGFFNGFNQYKSGGKGSDRDFWKSAADGGAVKVDRVGGTQFVGKTSVSVTGTIQPEILEKMMSGGDSDGFWSRFLWVRLPLNRLPAPDDGPKIDLNTLLHSIYRHLEDQPPTSFHLSPGARTTWRGWHEWCEDRRLSSDTPVERVLYPKYRDRAGRVALGAHCLEYAYQEKEPPREIPNSTLEAAIAFVKYCLTQTRLLYSEIGLTSELTGDLLKVYKYLKRKSKPLSARDITQARLFSRSTDKSKQGTSYLRGLLSSLVEHSWIVEQDGFYQLSVEQMLSADQQAQEPIEQRLQPLVKRNVEQLSRNGKKNGNGNGAQYHSLDISDEQLAQLLGGDSHDN